MIAIRSIYERRNSGFDSLHADNLTYFPHIHPHIELLHVVEGAVEITVDNCQSLLTEGDLAVVFPNTVHSYQTTGSSKSQLVIYSPNLLGEYSGIFLNNRPCNPHLKAESVHNDIKYMIGQLQTNDEHPIPNRVLRGYLLVMTGRILEQLSMETIPGDYRDDLLQRLLIYLDSNFHKPLTLELLSQNLGVSKFHLSRCFTHRIGCSFNDYLNSLRVGYAQDLLLESGLSITDICYESGFESLSTFYRAFQKKCSETPGGYKKGMLQHN